MVSNGAKNNESTLKFIQFIYKGCNIQRNIPKENFIISKCTRGIGRGVTPTLQTTTTQQQEYERTYFHSC